MRQSVSQHICYTFVKNTVWLMCALCLCLTCLPAHAEEILPVLRLEAGLLDYVTAKPGVLTITAVESETVSPITVKYRGTYSATFTGKRNYSFHLKTDQGEPSHISLLGLRTDDDYVLLGGLSDPCRLRAVVGLQLWRSLNYPAPQSAPCELYFNDYYKGIYFLVERPDRKSAGVPKGGALYRVLAASADDIDLLSMEAPDAPTGETWYNIGKVWPEEDSGWQPLMSMLNAQDRAEMFNLAAFADYYLFVNLIGASDNMSKNLYLCWDGAHFSPMPWDLDAAFGRLYNASPSSNDAWYSNSLFDELLEREDFQKQLRSRWLVLRETLSPAAIDSSFDSLNDLLAASGAWEREAERFAIYTDSATGLSYPFAPEPEMAFIHEFILCRYTMLDTAFLGGMTDG